MHRASRATAPLIAVCLLATACLRVEPPPGREAGGAAPPPAAEPPAAGASAPVPRPVTARGDLAADEAA